MKCWQTPSPLLSKTISQMLPAPAVRKLPTDAPQLSPAPSPEPPPPPALQILPASSTTSRSHPGSTSLPTGWPQTVADKTSPHKKRIPIPPSARHPRQKKPSAHTRAAPPPQNPARHPARRYPLVTPPSKCHSRHSLKKFLGCFSLRHSRPILAP